MASCRLRIDQAAVGLHDLGLRQTRDGGAVQQPREIRPQQRGERGVDLRRRSPFVLAEGSDNLVREREVHSLAQSIAQRGGEQQLVDRVAPGVQEADRDRLRLTGGDRVGESACGFRGERALGRPRTLALRRAEASLRRSDRLRCAGAEAIELRARLTSELDQVGEPLGCDERGAGVDALQQGVGRDGHAVGHGAHVPWLRHGGVQDRLDGGHHAKRLVLRSGRGLRGDDAPGPDEDRVGERPSDIDSEQHHVDAIAAGRAPVLRAATSPLKRPSECRRSSWCARSRRDAGVTGSSRSRAPECAGTGCRDGSSIGT
ncbi:unannotated protein [freshwater metagenome]|uniref:Unannotated protein n=1 Tax=freshwater metagenome TaxID=449393 RepID=A0A6J7E0B2_9ZZZZ